MDRSIRAAVWPLRIPFSPASTVAIVRRFAVHVNGWRPPRNALERRLAAVSSRILRLVGISAVIITDLSLHTFLNIQQFIKPQFSPELGREFNHIILR